MTSTNKFAHTFSNEKLPVIVSSQSSALIKTGKGIDITLQRNKAINIKLACEKIYGIVIHPGEVFSFWKVVGKITKRKGYKNGRIIHCNNIKPGLGGGLCNLGNTIHRLILHSPLDVIEFHKHSDALAPDSGVRVPFSSGTSINYNYIDYMFKNNTDQNIQLLVWCDENSLFGELRSEVEFSSKFELLEEDHHFRREEDKFFRISKIYKITTNKKTNTIVDKSLVLDNHSEVMFDYELIPKELIR